MVVQALETLQAKILEGLDAIENGDAAVDIPNGGDINVQVQHAAACLRYAAMMVEMKKKKEEQAKLNAWAIDRQSWI
jgi:hypothetical protein